MLNRILTLNFIALITFTTLATHAWELSSDQQANIEKIKQFQLDVQNGTYQVMNVVADNKGTLALGGSGTIITGIIVQKLGTVTIQNGEQVLAKSAAELVKIASTYVGQVNGTAGKMLNIVETNGAETLLTEGRGVVTRSGMRSTLIKGAWVGIKDLVTDYSYRGVIILGRGMVVAGATATGVGAIALLTDLTRSSIADLNVGETGDLFFASRQDFYHRFTNAKAEEILALYENDSNFKARLDGILGE